MVISKDRETRTCCRALGSGHVATSFNDSRMFHLYGDVTITGEGLQIWTYTQHS